MSADLRYWIAINGATCAISQVPMRRPIVTPTPFQLIGFPTCDEAREAQRICLEAPTEDVRRFMQSLVPAVDAGRVLLIQSDHPEPPVPGGTTMWLHQPLPENAN